MLRWPHDPLFLGLGSRSLTWLAADGAAETLSLPWLAEAGGGGDAQMRLAAALADLLTRQADVRRRALRLVVADTHIRYWSQTVPYGTRSLGELRAVAMARCTQLFGGTAMDWRLMADWRAQGKFLCAALPAWIARAFESVGSGGIDTMLGQQLQTVRMGAHGDEWVCLGGLQSGAVVALRAGQVMSARTFALDAEPAERAARVGLELQRASLREGLLPGVEVSWFDALQSDVIESVRIGGVALQRRPLLRRHEPTAACDGHLAALLAMQNRRKGGAV